METKTMSFRDTIILAMSEEMRLDENVLLMGEDVGIFGGDFGTSVGMLEEFGPERVRDCPISEAADYTIPLGVGDIKKEGTDVTVVTYGKMLRRVMQAAEELVEEGISVEVVDPRTLVPLDKDIIINSVKKTGKVVLVNDAHKTSGYIGEISAIISESEAFDYLDAPIRRCAGEDVPMPYAQNLENAMIPTVESIKEAIRKTYHKE